MPYANPEKQKEYTKNYNATYGQQNKDTINSKRRERYKKNPERFRAQREQWVKDNPVKHMQSYLRASAKIRAEEQNVPFNLTYKDIIIPEFCPIFPWIRLERNKTNGPHDASPTLDKIIPSKGYVVGNIQVISARANNLKSNASLKELKAMAKWVETLA